MRYIDLSQLPDDERPVTINRTTDIHPNAPSKVVYLSIIGLIHDLFNRCTGVPEHATAHAVRTLLNEDSGMIVGDNGFPQLTNRGVAFLTAHTQQDFMHNSNSVAKLSNENSADQTLPPTAKRDATQYQPLSKPRLGHRPRGSAVTRAERRTTNNSPRARRNILPAQ